MQAIIKNVIIHAPHLDVPPVIPMTEAKDVPVVFVHHNPISKGRHLIMALKQWNREGRKLAPKPLRKQRLAACHACDLWNPKGNLGLGECGAPGCGCTKYKAWALNEVCPNPAGSRWPDVKVVTTDSNATKSQP